MQTPHFLIIRLSAIGDIVMASGLIQSLKAQYPDCKITWLAEPVGASLLKQDERIDSVLVFDKPAIQKQMKQKHYLAGFRLFSSFVKQLRETTYDYVIDTQGLLKSSVLAGFAKSKHSVGFKSKEKSHWFVKKALVKQLSMQISSEYRQLAKYMDCPPEEFQLKLKTNDSTKLQASKALAELGIESDFICVAPFTTRPQKHWIESHWIVLISQLRAKYSLPIVILGGPGDEPAAKAMLTNKGVHSLCGKTSLLGASEIINKAAFFVGVDTGLTHMAVMHKKPMVAIFGSTCPYLETDNPDCKVLYENLDCAPCKRRPTCGGEFTCMQNIKPERIEHIASEYLDIHSRVISTSQEH